MFRSCDLDELIFLKTQETGALHKAIEDEWVGILSERRENLIEVKAKNW